MKDPTILIIILPYWYKLYVISFFKIGILYYVITYHIDLVYKRDLILYNNNNNNNNINN